MLKKLKNHAEYIIIFLMICSAVVLAIRFLPREKILNDYTFSKSFFSRDGRLLRITVSYDDKYRIFYPLNAIPEQIQQAVLMYEDKNFYYHTGINPVSFFRAVWTTFITKKKKLGASTISMQTARILYNLNTKTVSGKLKQMFLALWLEMRYSKKDILEAYLNTAPYGYNIEGIGAASLIYFGKRLKDLDICEILTLAVIPQNPNMRRPSVKSGFEKMKTARKILYNKWKKKYPESKNKEHFFDMPMSIKTPKELPFYTPHIVNYLNCKINKNEIYTTIDLKLQMLFEQRIKKYIDKNNYLGIKNASVLLLNAKTMQAEVATGSADFLNNDILGQIDGIRAKRMAGSVLKTFIYGLALENGLICPTTLLKDTLQYFSIYAPENSDRQFYGPVFAQDALINSRNIPAIKLLNEIDIEKFLNLLKIGGVKKLKSAEHYGVSAAIGTVDVSAEEVAKLYSALLNGGKIKEINYTVDDDSIGNDGYKNSNQSSKNRSSGNTGGNKIQKNENNKTIFSAETAFILFDMLAHNPAPKNFNISDKYGNKIKVAWKTGTSYCFKDAWAAGAFGDYILVVWVGNFSGESNSNFWGRTAAGNLFFELVRTVVSDKNGQSFFPPDIKGLNVKKIKVCSVSGAVANKFCPKTKESYFIPGKSPINLCGIHRNILIDNKTGLRTNFEIKGKTHYEVYEFWPSDILNLFEKAGIKKKLPPAYMPNINLNDVSAYGNPPKIFLPLKDVIYKIEPKEKIIPLKADIDADADTVYWFVDGNLAGSSKKNETLFITASSGKHSVQAVDNLNRFSFVDFDVEYILK